MSEFAVEPDAPIETDPVYPDSDGQPMAENDLQFDWIVLLENNLELLFAERDDVYVAGNLLWYYEEGEPKKRVAPDAMVAFGRPKGRRGSYKQWEEGGVTPQVVFEVDSPGNREREMQKKYDLYESLGVEEYYRYDPDHNVLRGWRLREGRFVPIEGLSDWVSPRLGIRFLHDASALRLFHPDGQPFSTLIDAEQRAAAASQRAAAASQRAEAASQRAEAASQRAESEADRLERLRAWCRDQGMEPPADL